MAVTPNAESISPGLQRVAKLAKEAPDLAFKTLAHHLTLDLLRESFRRTRRDGAPGIDGQTAAEYEKDLEKHLEDLLNRAKSGRYRAPPVRRVHIPKGDGKTRPIGIPTFEDKVLQRAVAMVLNAVYEQDFLPCSFGFRPGRSAHEALETLRDGMMELGGGYVLEADIRDYFGTLDHARLREILHQRIRDGVLLRLIGKWLNAGVMEEGRLSHPTSGTPQGGVISPLLANIYLHEVLDAWWARDVKVRMRGQAFLIRYADDFVMVFAREEDARRVADVLPKRFAKYGLSLHPEKTQLFSFRRPKDDGDEPPTFDFLGFTHYWATSLNGYKVIKRKTAKTRLRRALRAINQWCRRNRHLSFVEQHEALGRKLKGHCAYYGITGNGFMLKKFRHGLLSIWRRWLCRRSHAARRPWAWFAWILEILPFPPADAIHSKYRHAARP
jgi:group II intron reverse transcriptase/maturase